jgi:hypothetical protein
MFDIFRLVIEACSYAVQPVRLSNTVKVTSAYYYKLGASAYH